MAERYFEILNVGEIRPDDLEILEQATTNKPGRIKLGRAYLAARQQGAPNSTPILSWTGAKIGFVAPADLFEPPYLDTYYFEQEV